MPTDASFPNGPSKISARLGGFLFGAFVSLAMAGVVWVAYSGSGLSVSPTPPEQIYFF